MATTPRMLYAFVMLTRFERTTLTFSFTLATGWGLTQDQPTELAYLLLPLSLLHTKRTTATALLSLIIVLGAEWGLHTQHAFTQRLYTWHNLLTRKHSCLIEILSPVELTQQKTILAQILHCTHIGHSSDTLRITTRKKNLHYGDQFLISVAPEPGTLLTYKKRRNTMIAKQTLANLRVTAREMTPVSSPLPLSWYRSLRKSILTHLSQSLPKNTQPQGAMAIFLALVFGIQESLTREQWHILQYTCTAHLVAISGLHIHMIAQQSQRLALVILAWLQKPNPLSTALVISQLSATGYGFLAGFGVACQRALLSTTCKNLEHLTSFRLEGLERLGLCAGITTILYPHAILSLSFLLSYGMSASIILLHQCGKKSWLEAHIGTSIVSMPFNLYFWHHLGLISPLTNLIAIPWITYLILPLSLISYAALNLSPEQSQPILHITLQQIGALTYTLTLIRHLCG